MNGILSVLDTLSHARRNAEVVVKYSTAYPFRLPENSLMCVYCCEMYTDTAQFRSHMHDEHQTFKVETAFAHCNEGYLKADCTDLKCRICWEAFKKLDDVAKHINDVHNIEILFEFHIGIQPFKFDDEKLLCGICDRNFPCLRQLSRHMTCHYQNYTCEECGKSYTTNSSLQQHIRFSHISNKRICRRCKKTFNSLVDKREHVKSSSKCWAYQCSICGVRFMTWTMKEQHLEKVHGHAKKTHKCPECATIFLTRNAYRNHFATIHAGINFVCSYCVTDPVSSKQMAKRNAQLVLQYSTAYPFRTRGNLMLCVYCCEEYADPKDYRSHMDRTHESFTISTAFAHVGRSKEYLKVDLSDLKCRLCLTPCNNLEEIALHIRNHHGINNIDTNFDIGMHPYKIDIDRWSCFLCNKKMASLTKLCRHTTCHYQKYTCDVCGRSYLTYEALKYHIRCSHSGNYVCRKCWTDFPTLEKKREHVKNSKACWGFICLSCGERFKSWESKQRHLVDVHGAPKKMFTCPDCEETFDSRKHFYNHFKLNHSDETFVCSCCGLKFTTKSQLEEHRSCHTGEKPYRNTLEIRGRRENESEKKKIVLVYQTPQRRNAELILRHSTAYPFKTRFSQILCAYCHDEYNTLSSLRYHMKNEHKTSDFKNVFYRTKDNLIKVDITNLKCNICNESIQDIDTLMGHLSREHNKPVKFNSRFGVLPYKQNVSDHWVCVYCQRTYIEFVQFKRHIASHFMNFSCDKCGTTFISDHALRDHRRQVKCFRTAYKPRNGKVMRPRSNAEIILQCSTACPFRTWKSNFNCVFCRVQSNDPSILRSHVATRHENYDVQAAFYKKLGKEFLKIDITDLQCKLCFMPITNFENLTYHLMNDHQQPINSDAQLGVLPFRLNDGSVWKCTMCPNVFKDFVSLNKHTSEHFQNYVCDTCGEGFITESAMIAHTKVPHENKYSCSRCVATFCALEERNIHVKTQHTSTPYMCVYCKDKPRFANWELRKKHLMEVHNYKTGADKYECATCQKSFKTRPTKDIDGLNEKERKQKKGLFERSVKHNPQRRNAVLVLRHSTAIPFKTRFNRILCSYCHDEFQPMEALRIHIKEKHINADFNSAFYKVVDDLKIDISHFKCNLCSRDIENVETFMNHLSGDHGKPVNFDVPFGVLPYRQNETGSWLCLHCDKIYPEFSQINSHLRTHAKISTCDKCGATFLSEHGLKQHERNFQCYKATYKPRFGKALKHKYNTEIILQCSTACPFRTWGQNFNCVFCRVQSNDPNGLRAHMASRHANFDIQLVFSRKLRKEFLKVDITDLQCKLCFMHIDTLDDLLTHLKNDHKQPVNIDVQPGVLPFKLNDGSCWQCAICKIQFSDFISLKKHTAEHYQNYVCDTCGEGFITEVALRAHTKIPHDNKYTCSRCVATFSTLEERSVHIKTQHTNLPYMCTYCKDKPRFATWELRKRHLYEIHNYKSGAEMYECTTCHMMFKTRSQKYHHNVKVHRTKKEIDFGFSCGRSRETENVTDINILQQSHLDTDNDIKVGEKRKYQKSARSQARFMTKKNASSILECWSGIPFRWKKNRFKCAYCEENFNECSDLRAHVRLCSIQNSVGSIFSKFKEMTLINMDVSEAVCRICSEPFRELDGMREHVIRHGYELDISHPDGVIPFCLTKESWSCVLCRETFNNFLKLYEHMNTHYQYHICSICGKGYMTGPRLRKHLELHITGTFPCDKCKKVFTKRTGRDNHKAYAHAKGPRYECPQCNMRFEGYYDRMNHLKQAHREKEVKYGCSHCDLSFKTSGKRAIHVKTVHFPRQSNFSCPYCKTLFKTAFGMKRHMVKHNGETCTVCGESFTKSKALKEHLAGHADGLRCKWCGNSFKEAALLLTHLREKHPEVDELMMSGLVNV
ncbi:unnamed protein product [Danaus chrysippus]|uniref:(African queen) hypothetical protein n=1 Tax=Danaus chrysippus TaxID=151541 RepID=A0A8J2W141_9NEOP|nr:unnamed protein product [Danaus chrysippus]